MVSEPPLILAFDTSAAHCAAALVRGPAVLARRDEAMDRGQAERLLPMLEEMLAEAGLAWADLDGLAVCTGPGNFTGLRLAVATARGLAMALAVPAGGVTVFEALAASQPGPALVTLENRRSGLFAQLFRDGQPAGAPVAGDLKALAPFDPTTICLGFAADEIAACFGLTPGAQTTRADPAVLARIVAARLDHVSPPIPLYLRPADALPSSDPVPVLLDDA